MSSSKAKKKRKKQRLRLKKKKFNLKELLKKLERDRLADLWRKLAASMAAFDNHSGTRGRPIWEDGLGLFCNKKAMKALKPYSQPFEPTPNDLNRLQPRAGHTVRSSLNSEATKASQPPEQPFQTRLTSIQKSQFSETSIRALEKIQGNVRRVVQADAILVNSTVHAALTKFSWQSTARPVQKQSKTTTPVPLKHIWEGCSKVPENPPFTVNFQPTDNPIQHIQKPSVRYLQSTVARPPPESHPPAATEDPSAKPPQPSPSRSLPAEQSVLGSSRSIAQRQGRATSWRNSHHEVKILWGKYELSNGFGGSRKRSHSLPTNYRFQSGGSDDGSKSVEQLVLPELSKRLIRSTSHASLFARYQNGPPAGDDPHEKFPADRLIQTIASSPVGTATVSACLDYSSPSPSPAMVAEGYRS